MLALDWTGVQWEALAISKARDQATGRAVTPKTAAGVRTISATPLVLYVLAAYRDQQRAAIAALRERALAMLDRYGHTTQRAAKARRILASLDGGPWER